MSEKTNRARRIAVKLTAIDRRALDIIQSGGLVSLVSHYRFARLVSLGMLISNNDGLLDDTPQSYRIAGDIHDGAAYV